jgi:predicted nucleic acid-binding protein
VIVVVDASVWLGTLLHTDPFDEPTLRWLQQYQVENGIVAAPTTLLSEVAGAYARRTGQADIAVEYSYEIQSDPRVQLYSVDGAPGDASARLAAYLPLKGSDAVYVALAQGLGVPLVTRDREQLERGSAVIQTMTPEEMETR